MSRSDLIDLATDAGLDNEWCLNSASNQIVDKLIAEFGV